ncbi:MAG: VanW family protein, partial [Candidatus Eremiobacterota bacterium]
MRRQILRAIPLLYRLRVHQLRLQRHLRDLWLSVPFASRQALDLPVRAVSHQSLLRRRLGDTDPQLQENKVVNLRLASPTIDGLVLDPGQVFSLWQRVGPPVARRGYIDGVQLSQGEVRVGVGGGLCQLANLLYWMALHTPLRVIERHHHSFDAFPDSERVLPFGSGAGIFYNYVDLRFYNPTEQRFQLKVWVNDKHLKGEVRSDREWPWSYSVFEKHHRFTRESGQVFRSNEIWRRVIDRATGERLCEERLMANRALV